MLSKAQLFRPGEIGPILIQVSNNFRSCVAFKTASSLQALSIPSPERQQPNKV
jgi:hypothetical protein